LWLAEIWIPPAAASEALPLEPLASIARPAPQPPVPHTPLRLIAWTARKACETHVIMNVLSALAIGQLLLGDAELLSGRAYLVVMAPLAATTAAWTLWRSQRRQGAEAEFAAWYRVPPDSELVFAHGWWIVEPHESRQSPEDGKSGGTAEDLTTDPTQSS